jgi:hypothetical protein
VVPVVWRPLVVRPLLALGSLHRTMEILSVHPFEKVPLHELLTETPNKSMETCDLNQLSLWQLKSGSRVNFYQINEPLRLGVLAALEKVLY